MPELLHRTAAALVADLKAGTLTAEALTVAYLERISEREPEIHAWAYLDFDLALRQARAADARRREGAPLGPLHGLPVGVKDIIDTADMPTERNSPLFSGRRPIADATLVARLRAAGAIVLGKTVTSEFAVYTPGPTRNPSDIGHSPGGSSSGSAAAVAAGMVPLALATQTNASTIRPAAYCGIVGYKPGLGVLPRTGILKQATIIDQPGLMAADVMGIAMLADALAGPDPQDELSLVPKPAALAIAAAAPQPPRLAFVRSPSWSSVEAESRGLLEGLVRDLGGRIEEVTLPAEFESAIGWHRIIMHAGLAEACRDHYVNAAALMSDTLRGIVESGRQIPAMEFDAALDGRSRLRVAYRALLGDYDAILTPAATGVAPRREEGTGDPVMGTLWTLLGAPAITLPLLRGAAGLPVGVQLVGRLDDDAGLVAAAAWLEHRAGTLETQR